jgi:hypothetical protein
VLDELSAVAGRTDAFKPKQLEKHILKLANLVNLPDDQYDTLKTLRKANFWNGKTDTFWEGEGNWERRPADYKNQ